MPNKKNHWVSQREDGNWTDKREGNTRASGIYNTQQEAFDATREAAKQEGGEIIISVKSIGKYYNLLLFSGA